MTPLLHRVYRDYPNFVETMARRHLMYNRQLDEIRRMEEAGEILVIRPSRTIKIHRTEHDPDKIRQMYDLGRQDGEKAVERVRGFLQGE